MAIKPLAGLSAKHGTQDGTQATETAQGRNTLPLATGFVLLIHVFHLFTSFIPQIVQSLT